MSSMIYNFTRWMAGSSKPNGTTDEVLRALDQYCVIPAPLKDDTVGHISNNAFVHIESLLLELSKVHRYPIEYAWRPRIFTVLKLIDRLDVMPIFVRDSVHDVSIPFTRQDLPPALGYSKDAFLKYQKHVCTPAREIELGVNGHHVNLAASGDELFIHLAHLGRGSQGNVQKVLSRLGYTIYARKVFPRRGSRQEVRNRQLAYSREVRTLKRLDHHHLVRVVGSYSDPSAFAILMEPVADQNFEVFLNTLRSEHFHALRYYFGCLTNAISYLHSQKAHHMDLKLSNILIKSGQIYLADFGSVHDFSSGDRSTTQSLLPYTPRYAPPELFRKPRATRNWATDMWSLGVVFLEMTTVLRGKRIQDMRNYLRTNGRKEEFVSCNPEATHAWFSILQVQRPEMPSDNEPLMWIRDLIQDVPSKRPRANDLMKQISTSLNHKQWIGPCCTDDEDSIETRSVLSSRKRDQVESEEDGAYAQAMFPHRMVGAFEPQSTPAADQRILSWQADLDDFHGSPYNISRFNRFEPDVDDDPIAYETFDSPLYDVIEDESSLPSVSEEVRPYRSRRLQDVSFLDRPPTDPREEIDELGAYDDGSDHGDLFDVESDSSSSAESEVTVRPFNDLVDSEDETSNFVVANENITIDQSGKAYQSGRLVADDKLGRYLTDRSYLGGKHNSVKTDLPLVSGSITDFKEIAFVETTLGLPESRIEQLEDTAFPDLRSSEAIYELPGDSDFAIFNSTDRSQSSAYGRSRFLEKDGTQTFAEVEGSSTFLPDDISINVNCSQDSFGMQSTDKSEVNSENADEKTPAIETAQPQEKMDDDSFSTLKELMKDLKATKLKHELSERAADTPEKNVEETSVSIPTEPKGLVEETNGQIISKPKQVGSESQTADKSTLNELCRNSSDPQDAKPMDSSKKTESKTGVSTKSSSKAKSTSKSLKSSDELRKSSTKAKSKQDSSMSEVDQKLPVTLAKGQESVASVTGSSKYAAFLSEAGRRAEENAKVGVSKKRNKKHPAISAEQYIKEVYTAASEAATSVLSEKTRQKLSGSVSMTRWWDRDYSYLEEFTKQGKAGAVRILCEKGCNPGTLDKPRPKPVLNAVIGASARHTKCLRILFEHGANPNVRRVGKPALHIAVDHTNFKGYGNLICELLLNGADPDIRDKGGDTALHKILMGGYEPLEKYRRDALALLLYFGADVDAVPLGTLQKPLHLAVRREDPWAVSMLLLKGAAVDTCDSAGVSPLAMAVSRWRGKISVDQREVLLHLLDHNADVNQPIGTSQLRALHAAITCQDEEVVRILVEDHFADFSLQDSSGKDASQVFRDLESEGKLNAEFGHFFSVSFADRLRKKG